MVQPYEVGGAGAFMAWTSSILALVGNADNSTEAQADVNFDHNVVAYREPSWPHMLRRDSTKMRKRR